AGGNGTSPEAHDRGPTGSGRGPGLWDVTGREYLIILPLVAAILFLGVYPKPVLARINPSARSTCAQVRDQSGHPRTQPPQSGILGSVDAGVACDVGTMGRGSQPVPEPSPSLAPLGQEGGGP